MLLATYRCVPVTRYSHATPTAPSCLVSCLLASILFATFFLSHVPADQQASKNVTQTLRTTPATPASARASSSTFQVLELILLVPSHVNVLTSLRMPSLFVTTCLALPIRAFRVILCSDVHPSRPVERAACGCSTCAHATSPGGSSFLSSGGGNPRVAFLSFLLSHDMS